MKIKIVNHTNIKLNLDTCLKHKYTNGYNNIMSQLSNNNINLSIAIINKWQFVVLLSYSLFKINDIRLGNDKF